MGSLWQKLARPFMFALDAEHAHELGIMALRTGIGSFVVPSLANNPVFENIEVFGLKFANPIGLAAGFDKNGAVVDQLASLGFGFVEIGTVTLEPQPGNPKPRLFRLPADKALINRLGFNNDGASVIAERLRSSHRKCLIGVNIGRNKDVSNEAATENYLRCFETIYDVADYVTVNVSSPNTPDLRDLQRAENLDTLLTELQSRNRELASIDPSQKIKPLLVKIAPDLTEAEIVSIVDLCMRNQIAGIIATNTTISRDGLTTPDVASIGSGGLSGQPLRQRATEVISTIYRHSQGKLLIIGVGGIFTAQDAFEKIAAGASLLQVYTGFVYGGPSFAVDLNRDLARIVKSRGFANINEAVGSGIRG